MMRNIKSQNLIIIAGVVILIGVLVLFRTLDNGYFRNNLSKWAKPSLSKNNLVTLTNLVKINNPLLLIIGNTNEVPSLFHGETLKMEITNLVNKEILQKIRDHQGSVVLFSEEPDIAAKAWMILSQMGLSNLYLLDNENNETFRYEFRPDTLARPEI